MPDIEQQERFDSAAECSAVHRGSRTVQGKPIQCKMVLGTVRFRGGHLGDEGVITENELQSNNDNCFVNDVHM